MSPESITMMQILQYRVRSRHIEVYQCRNKFKLQPTVKVMVTEFWDSEGIIFVDSLQKGNAVTVAN